METGLLILRLAIGITLAAHGAQKLFGWFGGGGLDGTAPIMEYMGFRPGRLQAALAGAAETFGGLFLAAGLLTPFAAAALFGVMIVAAGSAHWGKGFFLPAGFEYTLVLGAGALAIAFTGPGAFSLDRVLGIYRAGGSWGLAALLVGVAAGGAQLVARRQAPAATTQQVA
jgi:putative oxidoreductase